MRLFFLKRLSIQTNYTPDKVKHIISDTIHDPLMWRYAGVKWILPDYWLIRTNFNIDRFQIALRLKNSHLLEREGIRTILKGRLRENKQGTLISMVIRPADEHIVLLSFVFVVLSAALVYAISNNISELMIVSSILVFGWYFGFLIAFNLQVGIYRRIIDRCFK